MAKFAIECPSCGRFAEAKTGFFARKKIDCSCGYTIDVRTDKLTTRNCPHCGNTVLFDQSKAENAKCPVCGEKINTFYEKNQMAEISCVQCGVRLLTNKNASTYTCPVCDAVNDLAERVMSEKIKSDGMASIIKYEGDNNTFIWKHPVEDFNYGSQLIVHESQEAIFFKDGQALDLFGPGRYTLETQQLPLLEKVYSLPTDTEGTFHSEVYFINKLRFNCEFDKAAGIYENIVADFPEEAEGYWGLLLCRYGIEYVDDPATGKKVATCHRSSFDSIWMMTILSRLWRILMPCLGPFTGRRPNISRRYARVSSRCPAGKNPMTSLSATRRQQRTDSGRWIPCWPRISMTS